MVNATASAPVVGPVRVNVNAPLGPPGRAFGPFVELTDTIGRGLVLSSAIVTMATDGDPTCPPCTLVKVTTTVSGSCFETFCTGKTGTSTKDAPAGIVTELPMGT